MNFIDKAMRKRVFLLFSFLCLLVLQVQAQSFVVKGKVTAADEGEGMISLTVMQKGTGHGVVTDFDGNYSIEIKGTKEATLVFTYVGYAAQEHVVNASTKKLDVVMEPEQITMIL